MFTVPRHAPVDHQGHEEHKGRPLAIEPEYCGSPQRTRRSQRRKRREKPYFREVIALVRIESDRDSGQPLRHLCGETGLSAPSWLGGGAIDATRRLILGGLCVLRGAMRNTEYGIRYV